MLIEKTRLIQISNTGVCSTEEAKVIAEELQHRRMSDSFYCCGYPICDGDLVGIPHSKECPMFEGKDE